MPLRQLMHQGRPALDGAVSDALSSPLKKEPQPVIGRGPCDTSTIGCFALNRSRQYPWRRASQYPYALHYRLTGLTSRLS